MFYQVCEPCIESGSEGCKPLWGLIVIIEVIYCFNCHNSKPGCSFVQTNWGIEHWPIIKKSTTRKTSSRKQFTEKQRWEVVPVPVEMTSEEPTILRPVLDPLPSASLREDTQIATPEMDNSSGPMLGRFAESILGSSTLEASADAWDESMDHHEILFFQDVSPYEHVLTSPRRALTSLRTAIVNLGITRAREQMLLNNHWQLVVSRQPIIDDLINRLSGIGLGD